MIIGVIMLRFCLGLVCLVLAVGAIDGPTGHEGDAWHLTFIFGALGAALMVWALPAIADKN
jgi:peptidoglycan/LPS O-acetylase OafA/YrhL